MMKTPGFTYTSKSDAKEKETDPDHSAQGHRQPVVGPYVIMRNSYQFELSDLEDVAGALDTTLKPSVYMQNLSSASTF